MTTTAPTRENSRDLVDSAAPSELFDRIGRRRSPVTLPGYGKGRVNRDRGQRRSPQPLSQEEIVAILRQLNPKTLGGCRDRALIVMLWRTGLRIREALDLKPEDLDLDGGFLRVMHGKGDRFRIVGIDPSALAVIREWLKLRSRIPNLPARTAPVFCTIMQPCPGGHLGQPAVRSKLKLLAERAGVEKRVHPHGFRHTHATELALENMPLYVIKEQLGHEYISTTERYIARLAPVHRLKYVHERPALGEL